MKKQTSIYSISLIFQVVLFITVFLPGCGSKAPLIEEQTVEEPKYQLSELLPADPPVKAENGVVVAAHPLAAETGLEILKEGGNAVDAAIAALFMLNVVEPHASGLGGGGFAVVRMAEGEQKVVVFRETAPQSIDPDFYYDPVDSNRTRMSHGGSSICVPGAAAGWNALYENWATMPLERLTHDAIDAAENGFPVDPTLDTRMKSAAEMILSDEELMSIFTNDGIYYEVGDTIRQPDLAKTLKKLTREGMMSFYTGDIAQSVVGASKSGGGFIELSDLEEFNAEVVDPVYTSFTGEFSGYEFLTVPPPSRGGVAVLEALNLFDVTGVYNYEPHSPESIHLMATCLQQAYIDAAVAVGDPHFRTRNWQELSTYEFAEKAAQNFFVDVKPGNRPPTITPDTTHPGNTTHLVVVDQWGNAVSLTQSINHFFGAGVIAPGTGLLMNDQMLDFSVPPPPGEGPSMSVNLIEGGKRPRSNMAPLIVTRDDRVFLIIGTPGGQRIPAAVTQIVVNVIAYDMDISAAIDYPRFFAIREHLVLENRFTENQLDRFNEIGYTLHPFPEPYAVYFGGAHGITIDHDQSIMYGAADKRRGGAARGY